MAVVSFSSMSKAHIKPAIQSRGIRLGSNTRKAIRTDRNKIPVSRATNKKAKPRPLASWVLTFSWLRSIRWEVPVNLTWRREVSNSF